MKQLKNETQKAVTTRFPMSAYLELIEAAEEEGTTVAEMVRIAWNSHQEKKSIHSFLMQQESRMVRKMFEVCAATSGLDNSERTEAMNEIKNRLRGGGSSD